MGSSLGPRFGSGLGSGSARARDYFSRDLFGLGSVQGPDRGWLKVGARLRTRLGLAWPGSGSVSHSALFGAGLARSLAQLGSVLTSVHYSLLVSKLNVISPDQLDSRFGSAKLGDRFDSVRFSCFFCFFFSLPRLPPGVYFPLNSTYSMRPLKHITLPH